MNPITSLNPKKKQSNIRTRFAYRFVRTLKQVNTRYMSSSNNSRARRSVEIKNAANMCMAATVGSKRAWSRAVLSKIRRRRRRRPRRNINYCGESETEELREIVPGGEGLDTRSLLDETAHYINCLTTQVEVMKHILHLYSSSS